MNKFKIFLIIFAVLALAAALFLIYKPFSEKTAQMEQKAQTPPVEIPQTNPFEEVKTNPFKDIRTNPFD